jgi:hypothetical protein
VDVNAVEVRIVAAAVLVAAGKLILTAMYIRRVGIENRSYVAAPTQVSTDVTW